MSGGALWCIIIPKKCWKVVTNISKRKGKKGKERERERGKRKKEGKRTNRGK
jgi:hypothetical protein